ncbi:MAG TPA: hypothetical protein VHO28_09310 [Ignavibacteriales bacterium]|nr:hypothetical protein [Ignavibacteriales bacterium]
MSEQKLQNLKCVWMDSQVVDYKLCDRGFDCENCPFDKKVRNRPYMRNSGMWTKQDYIKNVADRISDESKDENVVYLPNHLTLKSLFNKTYYIIGLSYLAINLLDNVKSVRSFKRGEIIQKDQPLLEIEGDWGTVSVSSPFEFFCCEQIVNKPEDLLNARWLGVIEARDEEVHKLSLSGFDYNAEVKKVTDYLSGFESRTADVGVTMLDGGAQLSGLSHALGRKHYIKLLNSLFNKTQE